MAEVPSPPEPELESQSGETLLAAISREMVRAMKHYYGRGPTKAKSYLVDDLLFVVMRGGTLQAEKTLLEAGFTDTVREFRQKFENVMAARLVGTVEQLTDRRVVTYQSQILFDPDVVVEIFVFDQPLSREAVEETARALPSKPPTRTPEPSVAPRPTPARRRPPTRAAMPEEGLEPPTRGL